jgi:hypothetical protein
MKTSKKGRIQSMIAFYSSVLHCCRMELAPILWDRSLRAVAKVSQGHDPPPFWISDVFKRTAAKLKAGNSFCQKNFCLT